jgi:hypothetical protein
LSSASTAASSRYAAARSAETEPRCSAGMVMRGDAVQQERSELGPQSVECTIILVSEQYQTSESSRTQPVVLIDYGCIENKMGRW